MPHNVVHYGVFLNPVVESFAQAAPRCTLVIEPAYLACSLQEYLSPHAVRSKISKCHHSYFE